ncbi:MAG: Rieske 2Fe-2S domain-containing protein [Proteobacteria bacterium]|nr:Rieske 2Fe-2S domain-containing protein [Pseudomonadota bacterium]
MSDALSYLLKARPEAMGHYFAFLKDCGRHLDPKTRNLISVITKVHAQTERGLRQYLKRALKEGCSPAEVLDALLMAFPTLGLTKILWAVDVMLAMDLPGFAPEAAAVPSPAPAPAPLPAPAPQWHDLMATTPGVPAGSTQRLALGDGRAVFVHRGARQWRVYDSRCPHQTTDIPPLALDGCRLTCPKHGWVFDLASGDCVAVGDAPLQRWPSKVVKGRLLAFG